MHNAGWTARLRVARMRLHGTILAAFLGLMAAIGLSGPGFAHPTPLRGPDQVQGPAGGTVIVMRHAEKPDTGAGLAPEGSARAAMLAQWLPQALADAGIAPIATVAAAADSRHSQRPRLTVTPLAAALHLGIAQPFSDTQTAAMADWLRARPAHDTTLVAWHHGEIPALLAALGADPAPLLPGGRWPETLYDRIFVLSYDAQGRLSGVRTMTAPPGGSARN